MSIIKKFLRLISLVMILVLVSESSPSIVHSDALLGAETGTLAREPQVTPTDLGDGALEGLQYADPAEQLDLIEPPVADNFGDAQLEHPITIPVGRAGHEPSLALTYDSGGGAGWAGTGWDLDVGEIVVDTRFGVPRFLADAESEGYILDGDVLSPSAVVANFESPRVANRSDFTRRIEDEFERIIRHGDSPTNYWWSVTSKDGTTRYYGATVTVANPDGVFDATAVQTDANGNIFRWALSAEKDISSNIIRYFYANVVGERVGADSVNFGTHLYLTRILYTGSLAANVADDPAYEIRFLRDDDISPTPTARKDIIIDARGGFVDTTSDLLRRIEINYGAPVDNGNTARTSWNTLVRAYNLNYIEGAFGKALLASVDQLDSTNTVVASHTFTYYDDVRDGGSYNGLSSLVEWSPGDDPLEKFLLENVDTSALGSSDTTSEDVHAYMGFNPAVAGKTGSFGGAFSFDANQTEGIVEFMDINGDLLPDKVFRESNSDDVKFRLNQSGPGGGTSFGPVMTVGNGFNDLSSENSIGIAGGPEAYPAVAVQFSIAGDVSLGNEYFDDVNNDGLPDFIRNGVVLFNRLVNGVPTFLPESGGSPVPLEAATANIPVLDVLAEFEQLQRDQSVVVDTVRRWIAPFAGTIDINAPVTFSPPAGETSPDGVRVAIQLDGSELWSATMTAASTTETPTGVTGITVAKGTRIYFRVGSIEDGAADQVLWLPTITYTAYDPVLPGSPATDSNGLSQQVYSAPADFTLAGRPDSTIAMPFAGTVRLLGDLVKAGATSDDLTVEVLLNGGVVFSQQIAGSFVGTQTIDTSFNVNAPSGSTTDLVIVRVRTDTPVDVTQVNWAPRLFYTSGTDGAGNALQVGDIPNNPTLTLDVPWDIDVYENNTLTSPQVAWVSPFTEAKTVTVVGGFLVGASSLEPGVDDSGDFVLSLKTANGLVGKTTVSVPESPLPATIAGSFTADVEAGGSYWFELTSRKPDFTARLSSPTASISYDDNGSPVTTAVPVTFHWAGRQGVFPNEYRGWAYAGYNAEGRTTSPIVESAFTFNRANYSETEPTGFDDTSYSNPVTDSDSYPYVPTTLADGTLVWGGLKNNLVGGADFASSSRTGADSPGVGLGNETGARAVPKVGVSGPIFGFVLGIGGLGAAAGGGPTFGLLDYMDLNGDAYPDIVGPNYVQYTGPRGNYLEQGSTGFDTVATDTTIAVGAGFEGSAIEIKGNSEGQANNAQDVATTSGNSNIDGESSGSSAANGDEASGDEYGANIGGAIGVDASFTNPSAIRGEWADILDAIGGIFDAEYELEYADINGDDLPDRVGVAVSGIFVQLNLGYGFAPVIRWSDGGFEAGEGYSGSIGVGLGFSVNKKEFSGGVSYNQSIDLARYTWNDIDGDGVLDRLRKEDGIDGVKVAFGTGAGLLSEVDYGTFESGSFSENIGGGIPTGQAMAQGESTGLGGGGDFTISIGPLCPPAPACYLIINPGAHFERSISNNQVQFLDVNGDGYPDSVKSTADEQLTVRSNNRGRTNLLSTINNPIGGQIRIGYTLDGNTVAQPYPIWAMTSVEYDDNRAGDGPDTLLTTYSYANNGFDSLEREFLGYATVIEQQRAAQEDGNPLDDPLLRQIERTYRNSNVFDAGLLTNEILKDPSGVQLKQTVQSWDFVDVTTGAPIAIPTTTDLASANALLATAASPQLTRVEFLFYDDSGNLGQSTAHTFQYDTRGNVIRQVDEGETETTADDLIAITTYSQCPVTGVSVPATFEIQDSAGTTLRHRDGRRTDGSDADLCANAVPIRVAETIDAGGATAVTEMTFDLWGNYNSITYPANENGERFRVDYVYDGDRHTDIAIVTDSYGLSASTTFDGPTGRITSRTDPNGQTTSYTYDAFGRIASVTGPYEQGTGNTTVSFAYFPTAPGYAYATASHYDAFNPGDRIETATFIDGIGRETQTKQDGTVTGVPGEYGPNGDVMVVGGAVEYDALGRPVKEWFPTTEALGTIGTYNTNAQPAATPLMTTWDLRDQPIQIVSPSGSTTTTTYGFSSAGDIFGGATLFTTSITDPLGKTVTTWTDVREGVRAVDDDPTSAAVAGPLVRTRYDYNPLGELIQVIDPAGSVTTHTYDLLGRRLTTNTPNGGLIEQTWDPAGNLTTVVDPVLRPDNLAVDYDYFFTRLVAINYPDATPDVSYTYGTSNVGDNGAGRVIALIDGAREQTFTYDLLGAVASEISIMEVHNLNDSTVEKHTYTTQFTYDGFGRRNTITYPDGEVVSHGYDSGGLVDSVTGLKEGITYPYVTSVLYDQFFDRKAIAFGNGTNTAYTYNPLTRNLEHILTNTPDREVQDLNYTYDATSKVTRVFNDVPDPKPNLFVGPYTQDYEYDPYYRIANAYGDYTFAPNKRRTYEFHNTYDDDGNISYKKQVDTIFNNPKGTVQGPTTYEINFTYSDTKPNQLVETEERTYTYDAAGNFTGWQDKNTGQNRSASFDSENRMVLLADEGSTTVYTYDHVNQLAIERGPGGELSFVNQWYTVENGSLPRKSIYVGDEQVVIKRQMPGEELEFKQYYQHKNLQGSTNIVSDENALIFQNLIYFPSGEIWVHEKSTEFPTPYRFAGGYFDEFREVISFGERWYDPRDQFYFNTDPILTDDPDSVIDDPALLPAYTYASSNPVSLVDPSGRAPEEARKRTTSSFAGARRPSQPAAAQASASPTAALDNIDRGSRLWAPLQAFQDAAVRKAYKENAERFDFKPLLELEYKKGDNGWQLESAKRGFLTRQKTIWERKNNNATDNGAANIDLPNSVPMPDAARVNGASAAGASAASGGAASLAVPDSARDAAVAASGARSAPAPAPRAP